MRGRGGTNAQRTGETKEKLSFKRTGRTGRRQQGGNSGDNKNGAENKLEAYFKKDEEFMKLKLNNDLDEYMKNVPQPNKEDDNTEPKEEIKATE